MRSALCHVIANIAHRLRIDNECRMAASPYPARYFFPPPDWVGLVI
ncbi:hypothetical protein SARI_04141 [Salmonella enterica subsp. arizonae serovar 62:z4,z23:-]|uniref:Uncharacterized protein n=1 Tax=Salmonella arizonae (strain ATCC BAA-731 / CDC346-86 / RSK2980) TaxID=41514 RepID=A9MMF1_SALAR|nr:hypothetical protein SARI_04141 [Salmonella enterica subsp. arizonae serovar 62:z4,z23:-]